MLSDPYMPQKIVFLQLKIAIDRSKKTGSSFYTSPNISI